jgi:hypothetical protein
MVSAPLTNFQINWIFKATGCFPALRGAVAGHSTMAINLSIPILVVEDYNTVIRIIRNRLASSISTKPTMARWRSPKCADAHSAW